MLLPQEAVPPPGPEIGEVEARQRLEPLEQLLGLRRLSLRSLFDRILGQRRIAFRGKGAGGDAVAGNALPAKFYCQCTYHTGQSLLGDGVNGVARTSQRACNGGQGHNTALAGLSFQHGLGRIFGKFQRGQQVYLQQVLNIVPIGVLQAAA